MKGPNHLQELTAEVQKAVDAYVKSDNVVDYKELQSCLTRLQVASTKPSDTLFSFRLQVFNAQSLNPSTLKHTFDLGQMFENAAIVMLLEMGVLDALVTKKGKAATAADLAAATGFNELVIGIYDPTIHRTVQSSSRFGQSTTDACRVRTALLRRNG